MIIIFKHYNAYERTVYSRNFLDLFETLNYNKSKKVYNHKKFMEGEYSLQSAIDYYMSILLLYNNTQITILDVMNSLGVNPNIFHKRMLKYLRENVKEFDMFYDDVITTNSYYEFVDNDEITEQDLYDMECDGYFEDIEDDVVGLCCDIYNHLVEGYLYNDYSNKQEIRGGILDSYEVVNNLNEEHYDTNTIKDFNSTREFLVGHLTDYIYARYYIPSEDRNKNVIQLIDEGYEVPMEDIYDKLVFNCYHIVFNARSEPYKIWNVARALNGILEKLTSGQGGLNNQAKYIDDENRFYFCFNYKTYAVIVKRTDILNLIFILFYYLKKGAKCHEIR